MSAVRNRYDLVVRTLSRQLVPRNVRLLHREVRRYARLLRCRIRERRLQLVRRTFRSECRVHASSHAERDCKEAAEDRSVSHVYELSPGSGRKGTSEVTSSDSSERSSFRTGCVSVSSTSLV